MCLCRYCPECKNDSTEVIAAGEKLRFSKKKSNMMSKKSECNRDWGKVGTIIITHNVLCLLVHVVTLTVAKYLHLPTVQFFLPNQNFLRGGGGGGGLEFSSPRNLFEVEYGYFVPDCTRSNLRGSKFNIFLGEHAPDPTSRHTRLGVPFTCYYHPATILSPPPPPPPPPPPTQNSV